jgi:hypothetical protein
MLAYFTKISNSKLSIVTFAISVITFWNDVNDITENFIQNLPIITVAIFVMVVLFLIHFYNKTARVEVKKTTNDIHIKKDEIPTINVESQKDSIIALFYKLIVLLIISLSAITMLSINQLRSLDIYYIKLGNYQSLKQAQTAKSKNQILFNSNGLNSKFYIKKRSNKNIKNPYLLCVNGGYIDRMKAENDLLDIQNKVGNQIAISIPPPTKNISIRKKIYYLVNRFNWFNK